MQAIICSLLKLKTVFSVFNMIPTLSLQIVITNFNSFFKMNDLQISFVIKTLVKHLKKNKKQLIREHLELSN